MARILLLVAIAALAVFASADKWAILVAGSSEYYNYRHQADICHAYQILHGHGIPETNIIVMMYDDIAENSQNPIKGKIFNKPAGPDVYHDVPKDYTGSAVTPANFLAALQGKATTGGSGKTLKSGPNDDVFIFFSDHGASGLIAFPTEYLYASDMIPAIKNAYSTQKWRRMVFYLEACESGSMFENLLPSNIGVYATSAANAEESSYAWYWNATLQAYMGDHYSISWMEDSDSHPLASRTLNDQFVAVKKLVNDSHVMQYGDNSMGSLFLSEFQAGKTDDSVAQEATRAKGDGVDSRDVKLATLMQQWRAAENSEEQEQLEQAVHAEINSRMTQRQNFVNIVKKVAPRHVDRMMNAHKRPVNFECLKSAVSAYETSCGKMSDYGLQFVSVLVNLCESKVDAQTIAKAANDVCKN